MKLLHYVLLLSLAFLLSTTAKAAFFIDGSVSNLLITGMEMVCPDEDGDGFMDEACGGTDCDDTNIDINIEAEEICNEIDDDCDGIVDDGLTFDFDFDGFSVCDGDCDDTANTVSPDSPELCFNGIDDDCDGMVDCDDEDDDDDLVDDEIEDGVFGGDGNNDGTADSRQSHVISIPNNVDGKYVTLETDPKHKLFAAQGINSPSPFNDPVDVNFPIGFFEFEIELSKFGEESFIVLYLPEGVVVNTFYKFGPTPDNPVPHWYDFYFDGETGAQFLEDRVVLRFVDGKRGDDDNAVNGMIFEPGGPGFIEILEESIDESDGCSIAGSNHQASPNTILNLFIFLIPAIVVLVSILRRKVNKKTDVFP